eukprot:8630461-Pyramimonas_sp.AAC.1
MAGGTAMIGQRGAGESGDETGTRQRRTPNAAMDLPPQQRRRSRLNGRLASPRLASWAPAPLVSARPNSIIREGG